MSKIVGFLLDENYDSKLKQIVKAEYTDQSKLLRKWIDENYKEEYNNVKH